MNNEIKHGDIVRLTDPISNGEVVRVEKVDEHGCVEFIGGSQYADFEQVEIEETEISDYPIQGEKYTYKVSLSDKASEIERKFGVKLYPESAVLHYKNAAEVEAKEHAYYEQAFHKEHNKLLDVQDNIEKLQSELRRCRAMNADYLTAKTEAENRAKLLKQEIADFKVPDSRRGRHLRDELHRSRLECQQALECANKEMAEKKELRERIAALKRQLDESNKQIEIYAKKVRNLEAELEEDGGLG